MISYTLVDALTDHVFEGSPCAVCVWDTQRPGKIMQSIAMELAVPDTIFIWPLGPGAWQVRFFSPMREESMSAHVLLAAAHTVLGENDQAFFETSGQKWKVTRNEMGLSICEPAYVVEPCAMHILLEELGLGVPVFVGQTADDWWLECRSLKDVHRVLEYDQGTLQRLLRESGKSGLVITAERDGAVLAKHVIQCGWRVVERSIAARAYRGLLPFWAERLQLSKLKIENMSLSFQQDDVCLSAPCVDAFVGKFFTIQGQMNLVFSKRESKS
jgi:predicted PhzF superfamily epimerase YddE/YHI9